jgi:hypothetical protein
MTFFTAWCQHHTRHCAITPHAPSPPAFRTAIYQSDLRFAIIPEEYHRRFIYPFKVCGRVKVFHGRQRWRSWAIGTVRRGVFRAVRNVLPKAGGAATDAPLPPQPEIMGPP